ncbi:MAG: branched-chain amino acid ABC transporter permease [Myxococcota bacterium]|nr:branched-chain amino acid ABC transporter permease [Myxococcota bacterium]
MPTRPLVTSYRQDLGLFPDRWHHVGLVLGTLLLVALPFVANAYWLTIANDTLVTIVGAVAMMILTGYTGQISLGHAAFIALGAYTAGIFGGMLMPFWLAIPAAGAVAAAVGLLVGPFALRLEGLYLAIVTLGLLYLVAHLLMSLPDLTGGATGLEVPMYPWFASEGELSMALRPPLDLFGLSLSFEQQLYFVFVVVAVITAFVSKNLQRSNTGRAMMAVRDHDLAAAVLGVDPARTKLVAFGVSSFFAGVAGALYGYQTQFLAIETTASLHMSVLYIAIIVFGGLGTTFGAIAGAIGFKVLEPLAHAVGPSIPLVSTLPQSDQATLLFALAVIGMLLVEPFGLLGLWLRLKRYFLAWPFRY